MSIQEERPLCAQCVINADPVLKVCLGLGIDYVQIKLPKSWSSHGRLLAKLPSTNMHFIKSNMHPHFRQALQN